MCRVKSENMYQNMCEKFQFEEVPLLSKVKNSLTVIYLNGGS